MLDILYELPSREPGYVYTVTPEVVRMEAKVQGVKESRPVAKVEKFERDEKKESA